MSSCIWNMISVFTDTCPQVNPPHPAGSKLISHVLTETETAASCWSHRSTAQRCRPLHITWQKTSRNLKMFGLAVTHKYPSQHRGLNGDSTCPESLSLDFTNLTCLWCHEYKDQIVTIKQDRSERKSFIPTIKRPGSPESKSLTSKHQSTHPGL